MLACLKKELKNNRIIFVMAACQLFFSTSAMADAPFYTDDTEILHPGDTLAILYAFGEKSNRLTNVQAPAFEFDYAFTPDFEVDTYTPVLTNSQTKPPLTQILPHATGLNDISFELKYRFLRETPHFPAFSFGPNFYLPTGNVNRGLGNGRIWYYLPISVQKSFQKTWTTYAELAYAVNSAPNARNYFFAGWVVHKEINAKLTLGGELYTQGASSTFNGAYTLFNLGSYYKLAKETNLLASIGHNVMGPERWSMYLGISWG